MKATRNGCNIDIEFDDGEQQCFVVDKDGEKMFLTPWMKIKANGLLVEIPGDAFILDKIKITEIK
ncbi:hypothetical protein MKK42_18225 [Escherichia coli]|uniref:hypothetical protein n=1 Tax=Escherichia coli TaxID=562 RepID=UPI001F589707|nr:hypothetical protein [Escherichia coli]MCI2234033.1 hypothetical protein [Escherichia coli]